MNASHDLLKTTNKSSLFRNVTVYHHRDLLIQLNWSQKRLSQMQVDMLKHVSGHESKWWVSNI
jgi:hypothetical protein